MALLSLGRSATYRESINQAKIAAAAVLDILRPEEQYISNIQQKTTSDNLTGKITFKNVFFHYPSRPNVSVLQDLSFQAEPGQIVAIVGKSGCGKSTCIQLLQQFYKPTQGQILIDNQSIESFHPEELQRKIGVVTQEPVLFATTILKNIQYGQPNATFDEIQLAAMTANAHTFIMSLPDKYDTMIDEHGTQLSGGERLRIVLARALLRNPTLLLLDEASSALDNQNEFIVQQALQKASKGRSTIIIAHRLSTVRHADKIIVIDNGRNVEEGNHETLIKLQSNYYYLVKAQVFHQSSYDGDDYTSSSTESTPFLYNSDDNDEKRILQNDDNYIKINSKNKIRYPSLTILKMNRPEFPLILIGALASIFNGGFEVGTWFLLSEIVGIYQECDIKIQNENIKIYVFLFIIIAILIFITIFTQNFVFACSGEALTKRLRAKAFEAILRQEISWFDHSDNSTSALCTRLSTEAATIQGVAGARLGVILCTVGNLGVGITIAFIFGWKLSLVALAFIPLMIIGSFVQMHLMYGYSNQHTKIFQCAGSWAFQALQHMRAIRQLTLEKQFINDYCRLIDTSYRLSIRQTYIFALVYSFTSCTIFFSMSAVLYYGAILMKDNEMSFRNVMIVTNCMVLGAQSIPHSAAFVPDYGKAVSAARRMLALFNRQPRISIDSHGLKLKHFTDDVHFTGVQFVYATRPHVSVLNNLNLDIKSGQRVAIVGTSGSGKSTLLHLIERFYDVQSGSLIIDTKDLRDINLHWWRSQLGLVSQEPTLFNVSIAENLAYGDLSRQVTMEEIIEAAKNANIHDFIQGLPQGYETCVGFKGCQLSGGQRQRIIIGRVLIRNPKLIALDEATSALDTENENAVNEALTRTINGRTSVVVAHRLSTIQNADVIFVLHNGYIIEKGSHHQLLAKKGFYYELSQCIK